MNTVLEKLPNSIPTHTMRIGANVYGPCKVHYHRHFRYLICMYLDRAQLDCPDRTVHFHSQRRMQQGQNRGRDDEPELGEDPEYPYLRYHVADCDYGYAGQHCHHLFLEYVQTADLCIGKQGCGREYGYDGEHDQHGDNDEYHLVALDVVNEIPEPGPFFLCLVFCHVPFPFTDSLRLL